MDAPTLLTVVKRPEDRPRGQAILEAAARGFAAVSYTHLTLPTSDLV